MLQTKEIKYLHKETGWRYLL